MRVGGEKGDHPTVVNGALAESVQEALNTPWILDCDTTVNVLYGHQIAAVRLESGTARRRVAAADQGATAGRRRCPRPQTQLFAAATKGKRWDYVVLVTNTDHPLETRGQLYRNRADCENGFDDFTRQWGWGGYTTHDLER